MNIDNLRDRNFCEILDNVQLQRYLFKKFEELDSEILQVCKVDYANFSLVLSRVMSSKEKFFALAYVNDKPNENKEYYNREDNIICSYYFVTFRQVSEYMTRKMIDETYRLKFSE